MTGSISAPVTPRYEVDLKNESKMNRVKRTQSMRLPSKDPKENLEKRIIRRFSLRECSLPRDPKLLRVKLEAENDLYETKQGPYAWLNETKAKVLHEQRIEEIRNIYEQNVN